MSSLFGFRVVKDSCLVGSKKAVKMGDTIAVSPAMYDLLSHAETEDELRRLLGAIPMLDIGDPFAFLREPIMFGVCEP